MGKIGKMAQMMANTDYNYAGGGGNEGVSVCVLVYLCVCELIWPDPSATIFFSICFVVSCSKTDIYFMLQLHFNFVMGGSPHLKPNGFGMEYM